jgi:hypothetical protein
VDRLTHNHQHPYAACQPNRHCHRHRDRRARRDIHRHPTAAHADRYHHVAAAHLDPDIDTRAAHLNSYQHAAPADRYDDYNCAAYRGDHRLAW